jgi:hypothetical protein
LKQDKNEKRQVEFGHDSNERVKRLKRSLNRVRWYGTLVQLFWTTGPITALGLMGGYYIGYGILPPANMILYFVSFSVLSGLIGLFFKIGYDSTQGHVEEQDEKTLLKVIDVLGDLMLEVGDLQVQSYEGAARKREAALQLLRRIDLTSYGVSIAFTHLTGHQAAGDIMAELHVYRRSGLHVRAREVYQEHKEEIEGYIRELGKQSPQASKLMKDRFTGSTSGTFRQGVEREKNFLQRVMSASEKNNPLLITLRDVEEMIALTFELLCEREIPVLVFSYSGRWKYAKLLDKLEEKRSKYSITQARAGNRIWAVAAFLRESGLIEKSELPKGLSMQELTYRVVEVIDKLNYELQQQLSIMDGSADRTTISSYYRVLKVAVELYEMAYKSNSKIGKHHNELIEAREEWDHLMSQPSFESRSRLLRLEPGKKRGLRIKEDIVSLSEEQRKELSRHLLWYLERENLATDGSKLAGALHDISVDYEHRTEMARHLALELAVALEPHTKLARPEIQRNVNATRVSYLGELTPDLSGLQKQEIGKRAAQMALPALDESAERLAEALVRVYHLRLDPAAVDFLHQTYGARKEMLEGLMQESMEEKQQYPSSLLAERPPVVPKPKPGWLRSLRSMKK